MFEERKKIIDRTLQLYVSAVSDAADEVGITPVCMDRGIKPLTHTIRMAGFARTGKLVRSSVHRPYDEEHLNVFMSLATGAQNGDIVCITSNNAGDCSVWGEMLTKIGIRQGLLGAVVDGTSRDIRAISEMNFPIFARGRHPATMRGRLVMESVGEPILCGGVTIHMGDLIFGDGDGIVVVPQEQIQKVLTAAEEVASTDTWWAKKLDTGEDPHELHKEKPIP